MRAGWVLFLVVGVSINDLLPISLRVGPTYLSLQDEKTRSHVFYDIYASSAGFFIRDRIATPAPGVGRIAIDSSGRVLFGGQSFTSSAAMQVSSTTGGFLPPKMTTTQRDAIASPVSGLMIYNTTTNQMQFYNGTTWTSM